MNIEQIARISHETNRAYCESFEQRLKDYLFTAVAEAFVKCEKLG